MDQEIYFVQKNIMSVLESVCQSMNGLRWSADGPGQAFFYFMGHGDIGQQMLRYVG